VTSGHQEGTGHLNFGVILYGKAFLSNFISSSSYQNSSRKWVFVTKVSTISKKFEKRYFFSGSITQTLVETM
jgi:hypothetical protein